MAVLWDMEEKRIQGTMSGDNTYDEGVDSNMTQLNLLPRVDDPDSFAV